MRSSPPTWRCIFVTPQLLDHRWAGRPAWWRHCSSCRDSSSSPAAEAIFPTLDQVPVKQSSSPRFRSLPWKMWENILIQISFFILYLSEWVSIQKISWLCCQHSHSSRVGCHSEESSRGWSNINSDRLILSCFHFSSSTRNTRLVITTFMK